MDRLHLHPLNLLRDRLGPNHMRYIHPHFDDYGGERVMRIDCWKARSAAILKDGKEERLYVRTGAATTELKMRDAQDFIRERFGQ